MSIKIFSNYSSLKLFDKNGHMDEMVSNDHSSSNTMHGSSDEGFGSPDDDPSMFELTSSKVPLFSIELGGGPQWWF
jgi:hypothetical protein